MPEFYPTYLRLCKLVGPDKDAHRFLTGYQPPAYISGCAQIVNENEAQLVRNYDFDPELSEGTLLHSSWNGSRVMAMGDCLIGLVDGINEHGLVVSLTFGGRKVVGNGFGIPFILRYILEFCKTIEEAVSTLKRIPSHMSYNVMLMNKHGEHSLVQVAPNSEAAITNLSASTNHQGVVDWPEHAVFTKTIERELYLYDLLAKGDWTSEQIVKEFLKAPLYNRKYSLGFGTIYTSVYRPKEGVLELRWPDIKLRQSFDEFQEGVLSINYSESIDISATDTIPLSQLQADYNGAVEAYWLEYGHSWTNAEHVETTEFLKSSAAEPLKLMWSRIQELVAQMENVSTESPVADWTQEADSWSRKI